MSDELIELPEGWAWIKLGELGSLINGDRGKSYPSKDAFVDVGIPFINAGHLEDGIIHFSKMNYITDERFELLGSGKIQPNDILYCLRGSLGKIAIVKDITQGAIASSLVIIRPFECTNPEYLFNFLISPLGKAEILKFDNGSAQPNLSAGSVKTYSVPLPPLNEQKRIVAKIEELRDRHHRSKQALEAIPKLCDRFRQSVLAAAFRGDLTADWREENPDFESASVLLERINNDLLGSKVQKTKSISSDLLPKSQYFQNLPEKWKLIQIRDVCTNSFYGPRFGKNEYVNDGVPTIRTTDMTESGEIVLKDPPKVKIIQDRLNDFKLLKDDLLITRTGSIGIMAIFREDYVAIPSAYLIRFRFSHLMVIDYIFYYLKSPIGQELLGLGSTAVTQPNINAEVIKSLPFPITSLAEQQEVVKRIKKLLMAIDLIEQQYKESKEYLDRLNQSILAKAFRGDLVEQDPNDEPASVLLERIRAERTQSNKTSETRSKRKGTPRSSP